MDKTCQRPPEYFGPLLGYCDHRVLTLMSRKLKQYDVSPMQSRTLVYLHGCSGQTTQKALERFLMVKPSTVNGIVDRLEEKGLLQRSACPSDGRCRVLRLTDRGMLYYDDLTAVARQVESRMERGFTPEELAALRGYLLRLADNLREEETE